MDFATTFYRELYKKRREDDNTEQQNTVEIDYISTIEPINETEVYKHIRQLKTEKSPGPDGLSNEALKIGAPILLNPLTQLFNVVLDTETVPK